MGGSWGVDARGAQGVQAGRRNIQYNYFRGSSTRQQARPPVTRDSPYPGLEAFTEEDEGIFFGRDVAAAKLLERMSELGNPPGQREWLELLVLSGVSGAGKSSLLRAGVLPRIRRGELTAPGSALWPQLIFSPTAAPLDALARQVAPKARTTSAEILRNLIDDPAHFAHTARQIALAAPDGPAPASGNAESRSRRLVIVVDQFEQLFTQCHDRRQRRDFVTALHAAASGRHADLEPGALVVLVVRADFEAQCADYPELKEAVQHRYLLTSMTDRQLRLAITEPAKQLEASVDNELVERLLGEMGRPAATSFSGGTRRAPVSGVGALPLLSHALNQTWGGRTGQTLTVADYERTGGIDGAVDKSAREAYDSLSPGQQSVARQVFTRLVATIGDKDTADRVAHADLTQGRNSAELAEVDAVLATFADKRLLTLDADTVEISHEVLLTAWLRLRDWLEETRDSRKARSRLHTAVAEWIRNSRHRSYLWELDTATDTEEKIRNDPHRAPLSRDEDAFLRASARAHHRRARLRQMVAALLTVLALLTTSLAAVMVYRGTQLAAQLAAANAETLGRESQRRAPTDIATAAQLALAGWRSDPESPQARTALANAYLALQSLDTEVVNLPQPPPKGITIRGDTALISADPLVAITGISGPTPRRSEIPHTSADLIGDLSPDGQWFAYVAKDGTVRVDDLLTRSEPRIVATGVRPAQGFLAFSPDGQRLASLASDGHGGSELRIWDLVTGALLPNGVGSRLGTDVAGFWLTPDPHDVLVRHGPRMRDGTRLVLHSLADGSELATMPPFAGVARLGAAVVSCEPPPSADVVAESTLVVTPIGDATPPLRFSALSPCGGQGLSDDGGWLVEGIFNGSGQHGGCTVLRLTDLRTGQSREVTVPSFTLGEVGFTVAYPLSALGVSTAAGQPAVFLTHGAALLRLRTEPARADQGKPPSRHPADGGRDVTTPIPDHVQVKGETTAVTVEDRATGQPIATVAGLDHTVASVLQGNSLWLAYQAQRRWQIDRYEVSPLRKVTSFVPPGPEQPDPRLGMAFVGLPATMLLTVSGGVLSALDPLNGRPLAPPVTVTPPGVNDGMGFGNRERLAPRPGHPGQVAVWGERDVQVWDALTGHQVATIPVAAAGNNSMAFDPSGQRIAMLTKEKTIELWNVDTVRQLRRPIPSADTNALVGFDADGYLDTVNAGGDGLVFVDPDQGGEAGSMGAVHGDLFDVSIVGDPVVPVDSLDESRPYELPVIARAWRDRLCAAADRPFTAAELAILPPGTDTDPPCS